MTCTKCNIGTVVLYSCYTFENPVARDGTIKRDTRDIGCLEEVRCNHCNHYYPIEDDGQAIKI